MSLCFFFLDAVENKILPGFHLLLNKGMGLSLTSRTKSFLPDFLFSSPELGSALMLALRRKDWSFIALCFVTLEEIWMDPFQRIKVARQL